MTQRRTASRSSNTRSRTYKKAPQRKAAPSRNHKSKKRGGGNIGWLLLALVVIAGGIFAATYIKKLNTQDIAEGVVIDGIDVSGMSKEEAYSLVEKAAQETIDKISVTFRYNDKSWHFGADELEAAINVQSIVDQAYEAGRNGSVIERYQSQQDIKTMGRMLSSSITVDRQVLVEALSVVKNEIDQPMVESSVVFDSSDYDYFEDIKNLDVDMSRSMFTITEGKVGYAMDYDTALQQLNDALAVGWTADIEIMAKQENPKLSLEELQKSTTLLYHSSSKISTTNKKNTNRNHNIGKAIGFYKGITVMPDEIVDYNVLLGERTLRSGWLEAPTITREKTLVDALGGGICQASTTIFNAAFMAGTKIIDRGPHSWPAYYQDYGYGMDAMVNWGTDEFIFQNTSDYPLFINTYFWYDAYGTPGYIDVDIYGMPQSDDDGTLLHIMPEWTIVKREAPGSIIYREDTENKYADDLYHRDETLGKMVYVFRKPRDLVEVSVDKVWYKESIETSPGVWEGGVEVKREHSHIDLYTSVPSIIYTKPLPVVTPSPESTDGEVSG